VDNYEHEIICPNNKVFRNYLWHDYFHDSRISNISLDCGKKLVTLAVECCREVEEMQDKLNNDQITHKECINEHIDSFVYEVAFKETQYFHTERTIESNGFFGSEYINGRFKDTALLRKISAGSKKPLYHFRIQINDGYADIIFSDCVIRKKVGRVRYPLKTIPPLANKPIAADDRQTALSGDDFDKFLAMARLFTISDSALLEIARGNLRLDSANEDTCLYSAYLLGKLGDTMDIPKLLELCLNIEEHIAMKSHSRGCAILPKRNILDAIELIHYRNGHHCVYEPIF